MATSILGAALFGHNPVVPDAPHVDINKETEASIAEASKNLPSLEALAGRFNEFTSTELLKGLNKVLPGYSDILAKEKTNIDKMLSGDVPEDVKKLLGQRAAEMGVARGTAGGSIDSETELRSLGLTSLDMIRGGFDAASRWIGQAAKPAQFDFTQFMLTPQQRIADQQWNEQQRWGPEWLKNQIKALGSPVQQATKGFLDWIATSGESMAGKYTGNTGGGSGGPNSSSTWSSGLMGGGQGPNYTVGGMADRSSAANSLMGSGDQQWLDQESIDIWGGTGMGMGGGGW